MQKLYTIKLRRWAVIGVLATAIAAGLLVAVLQRSEETRRVRLISAIESDDAETVQLIVRDRLSLRFEISDGVDLVTKASWSGSLRTLQALQEMGAELQGTNDNGRSILHVAVYGGNPNLVEWLVGKGLDVNAIDAFGNTPLGNAVRSNSSKRSEIIGVLLNSGANPVLQRSNVAYTEFEFVALNGSTNELARFFEHVPFELRKQAISNIIQSTTTRLPPESQRWLTSRLAD